MVNFRDDSLGNRVVNKYFFDLKINDIEVKLDARKLITISRGEIIRLGLVKSYLDDLKNLLKIDLLNCQFILVICYLYYWICRLIMWTISFNWYLLSRLFDRLYKWVVFYGLLCLNFSWCANRQIYNTYIRVLQRVLPPDHPGSYELQQLQMFCKHFHTGQDQLPRSFSGGRSGETAADRRVWERWTVWNC